MIHPHDKTVAPYFCIIIFYLFLSIFFLFLHYYFLSSTTAIYLSTISKLIASLINSSPYLSSHASLLFVLSEPTSQDEHHLKQVKNRKKDKTDKAKQHTNFLIFTKT
jgi:hypothetical protein